MNKQAQQEANPGCMEYAVIIALLIVIVPALLIASKLGIISEEQMDKLQRKFKPEADTAETSE